MQKYIRGLLYGSKKTKGYLWFLLILIIITVIAVLDAILERNIVAVIIAIFAGVLGLVIASSISFQKMEEVDLVQKVKKKSDDPFAIKQKSLHQKENENFLNQYNEKKLHTLFKEHKIKKVNEPVIVDHSERYKIKECPAYIWRDKNQFYLLLLEKKTRKIAIPLNTIRYIDYKHGVVANTEKDYRDFQANSFIGKMFGSFLPSYYKGTGREALFYKKNLYSIAPDICFTNTSARNLLKILDLNVNIKHSVLDKEEYAQYYQQFYQYNVLWKDAVITIEEYRKKIKLQLKNIAESNISREEYRIMIMKFLKYRWITDEYAEFFIEYKEKREQKKAEEKSKKKGRIRYGEK